MTKSECSTSQQHARNNNSNDHDNHQLNNRNYNKNNNYHYNNYYRSLSEAGSSVTYLNYRQVERLRSVLQQTVEIHGRENFPTLKIPLQKFIVHVKRKINNLDLSVKHVKLNGGAATAVLATADNFAYTDLDLIFPMSLATEYDFDKVRIAVFNTLLELMPETTNKEKISFETLKDIYIQKMIRVLNNEGDRWSLFSFYNHYGKCIELKFVDTMRRQFEFSVDSFQIYLDRLIENINEPKPAIQAESMYGNFCQALTHLNKRLIDTQNPEEIRGGGLLKYCYLLTRGYRPTYNCREMERYMCSRFFIDFPDINVQQSKLCAYLDNHFGNDVQMKYDYLHILFCVIKESTVCLMGHERRQTLAMVSNLRNVLEQLCCYNDHQQLNYPSQGIIYYDQKNVFPTFYYSTPMIFASNSSSIENKKTELGTSNDLLCTSPHSNYIKNNINMTNTSNASSIESVDSKIDADASTATLTPTSTSSFVALNNKKSGYIPRQTILYLPSNGTSFELVGLCKC